MPFGDWGWQWGLHFEEESGESGLLDMILRRRENGTLKGIDREISMRCWSSCEDVRNRFLMLNYICLNGAEAVPSYT